MSNELTLDGGHEVVHRNIHRKPPNSIGWRIATVSVKMTLRNVVRLFVQNRSVQGFGEGFSGCAEDEERVSTM